METVVPCFLCLDGPGFCQSNQMKHISVQYMVIISNTDTWLLLWRPMCSLKWWRREFIFDRTLRGSLVLFSVILSEHGLRMESREQNSERLWEKQDKSPGTSVSSKWIVLRMCFVLPSGVAGRHEFTSVTVIQMSLWKDVILPHTVCPCN